MGNPTIPHIPFRVIEYLGLKVLDRGYDRGRDIDIGEPAVDALDRDLKVVTPDGATVFEMGKDNLNDFITLIAQISAGTTVTLSQNPPGKLNQFLFRHGALYQHGTQYCYTSQCFYSLSLFRNGQVLGDRYAIYDIPPTGIASLPTPADWGKITPQAGDFTEHDYQNFIELDVLAKIGKIKVTDLLSRKAVPFNNWHDAEKAIQNIRESHRPLGVHAHPWGWSFQIHGLSILLYSDPFLGTDNHQLLTTAIIGLQNIPDNLGRLFSTFLEAQTGQRELRIHNMDIDTAIQHPDNNLSVLNRFAHVLPRLTDEYSGYPTTMGSSFWKLFAQQKADAPGKYTTAFAAVYSRNDNSMILLKPGSRTTCHEFGHGVEVMLGERFTAHLKTLHARYIQAMMKSLTTEDIAQLGEFTNIENFQRWHATRNRTKLKEYMALEARLYQWLPTLYTVQNFREFFAELFAETYFIGTIDSNLHYAPITSALKESMEQGKTPDEITDLFIQKTNALTL